MFFKYIKLKFQLHKILDINSAIVNAKKLLKKEGILILEVPNCKSLAFSTYQGEWLWSDIPRHLNFFTSNSLSKLFNKYNLTIVDKKYRGFCRQFSNSWLNNEKKFGLHLLNTIHKNKGNPILSYELASYY